VKRREFIMLLGGSTAWPLAARAQQQAMPVIGFLHLTSLETNRDNLATFGRGLGETGYVDGPERGDRVPLGRRQERTTAVAGG
jgi:putative ABC transport system substrate-binding protein